MKQLLVLTSILWAFGCQQLVTQQQMSRPNLILVIADDMAWDDSTPYGHPSIQTPNLDQLAQQGMRFDAAFLTTSSCSPSRSSIITGRYPHQTGAEQLHWPLPGEQITFVEKLKEAGYWTAQAGKWHLGNAIRDRFDLINGKGKWSTGNSETDSTAFQTIADGSGCHLWVETLHRRPTDQPFFLWLAATDPHRGYKPNAIPQPHQPEDAIIPPYMPDAPRVREDFALYYDEISRLDAYLGKVMAELEAQGIAENTVILFISDNGRPFPRDKTTLYDGGIKTPWIVRWPAQIAAGSSSTSLVSSVDIAPTFLALAGLESPAVFEGMDFRPILQHPETNIQDQIYAEDHWHDHDDFTRAVRTDEYKYIRNFYPEHPNTPPADALKSLTFAEILDQRNAGTLNTDQLAIFNSPRPEEELYDIQQDPYELNNLAADPAHAATLTAMQERLAAIREATDDALPAQRTPDEFDRETGDKLPNWKMPRVKP